MTDDKVAIILRATRIFDEAATRMQAGGLSVDVISSALLSTAISGVINREGADEAARWLRRVADEIESGNHDPGAGVKH